MFLTLGRLRNKVKEIHLMISPPCINSSPYQTAPGKGDDMLHSGQRIEEIFLSLLLRKEVHERGLRGQ